jgi:threonine synthase
MRYEIICTECGRRAEEGSTRCGCGAPLTIRYNLEGGWKNDRKRSIVRYSAVLPVKNLPPMHVGWTPITEVSDVLFKMEYLSAGGSFKDRGACVAEQKAKELGAREIAVDSSGNSAISFSLFAKVLELKARIFVPATAPQGKKDLLTFLGADVHEIEGTREEVNREAMRNKHYVGHWWNPYFIEGTKTIALEAFEQTKGIDCAVAPVGSGTLLLGLYKGFKELVELGELEQMPELIAVKASGYAFSENGGETSKLADGIAIKDPPRKKEIIKAVRESNGRFVVVNDAEIAMALMELRDMGFIVEPTSATAYAAYKKAKPKGKTLIPLTGSGLKLLDELLAIAGSQRHRASQRKSASPP